LNGNNLYNNKVDVDFVKKSVVFTPFKKQFTELHSFFYFLGYISYLTFYVWIMMVLSILILFYIVHIDIRYIRILSFILPLVISINLFLYCCLFLSSNFKNNYFPKVNKSLQKLAYLFIYLSWRKDDYLEVNREAIINNKFIIPYFKNISLEYVITGDYIDKIKRIYISNLFNNNAFKWFCVIEFKDIPEYGSMKISYF